MALRNDDIPNDSVFSGSRIGKIPNLDLAGSQPLGSQVYDLLRELLRSEVIKPGASIQTGTLASHLGVSKTPLRDALIQLQSEGFLKILPQRGVVISKLNETEVNELIQVLAGLESKAMMLAFPHLGEVHLAKMREINGRLIELLPEGGTAYREYNKLNIDFHNVFIDLCGNDLMVSQIRTMKERMYHFPDRDYGNIWRRTNAEEHQMFIGLIEKGEPQCAADFLRDVHWSLELKKSTLHRLEAAHT